MGSLYFMLVVFCLLLFIGQSFADGKDKDKKESSESDSESGIQKFKNKLHAGAAKISAIKKKVVPPKQTQLTIWDKFADTIVFDLKTTLTSTCVPGVRVENTKAEEVLTLTKGRLRGINQVYHRNDAIVVAETEHTAGIEFKLALKSLTIEYLYQYEAKTFIFPARKRRGSLVLQVNGVAIFSVLVDNQTSPRDKSNKNKQCYLKVKSVKLKEIPNTVRLVKVHSNNIISRTFYFIFKYLNFTVRGIKSSVKVVQEQIMKYVGEALEEAVQQGFYAMRGVCTSEEDTLKPPRDCTIIKPMPH